MKEIKNSEIADYVASLSDFQKSIVLKIRNIVLSSDDRVKESIKWGSIAFHHHKNICGFRVAKSHITLLFMEGALLQTPNILKGAGNKARTYKVTDLAEIDAESLTNLVKESLALGM